MSMRSITIIANWKMQHSLHESIALVEAIEAGLPQLPEWLSVILCPAFTALPSVHPLLRQCQLGAQDVFWEARGAYTGEIAPPMLTELGCSAVIIGHSERRTHLGETAGMIQQKVYAAIGGGLIPILCVGETQKEREEGRKEQVVTAQVIAACSGLVHIPAELFITYEPVWAIGSGHPVQPEDAEHMHQVILHALREVLPADALERSVRVLYGGSVDRGNVNALLRMPHVSGCLVGTASRRSEDFLAIIDAVIQL